MNIKYSKIPYMTGIKHLKNKSKYIWLQVYSALALAALGMIFLSHLAPVQITLHYGMQNSFLFISITYVLQLVCLIYGPQLLMHSTLMLEKIFRFYPSVEADYRNMESVSQEQW